MADHNRPQLPAIEPRHRILRLSGYAAATAFCAVSMAANLQYGLSLGKTPIDKTTYAVASVAADIFKMAAPLLALSLWSKRFHILSIAALVLWLGCVGWSMTSAVGFVLSSRGEAIAERAAEAATRHGWEAKVERAETQLATLGKYRPPDVIRAELAAAAVPQHIWRRSRQCHDLTLEESRLACAPVLGLRRELAAAEAAERLEAQLVAGRAQLATVAVPGSVADPQASALARLTGVDEGAVRTGIALLLAGLIEVGSALGFTLVSMATARNPQPPHPHLRIRLVHPTRRADVHVPGARPRPTCAIAGFKPGTKKLRPPATRNVDPASIRVPWPVRGICLHCRRPSPRRVCRCTRVQRGNCLPARPRLIAGFSPGSTWILLAASRRGRLMPISAAGHAPWVSSPAPRLASAGISRRASFL